MPILLVLSVLLWWFIVYVVLPIFEVITTIWPFILGGIGVLIAVAIYRALPEGSGLSTKNQRNERIEYGIKLPVTSWVPDRIQWSAFTEDGNSSFKDWSATQGDRKVTRLQVASTNGIALTAPPGVPTRGLVIMEEPLNKILQGRKTMELRSKHNRQLGLIALIRKGSGKIYGIAEIVESIGPMSFDEFRAHSYEHAVEPERLREIYEMGWNHGWRLKNVVTLKSPVSYIHKGMSQVKLDPGAIEALSRQLARV